MIQFIYPTTYTVTEGEKGHAFARAIVNRAVPVQVGNWNTRHNRFVEEKDLEVGENIKIMLDSGAFSAWKQGVSIDLPRYIRYIKENKYRLHTYVNLDVIPGEMNVPRTREEVERSAKLSYENLQIMKKAGLNPIPVYHQGEDMRWLRRMILEGHDYIGISPSTDKRTSEIIAWLDEVFSAITSDDGRALIKTHGFGVASFEIMKRYPWHTCDATSWALTAGYGSILLPKVVNGKSDYTQAPIKITISDVDPKTGTVERDHYRRMGPLQKARVRDFVEKEVGIKIDLVVSDYDSRAQCVIHFYQKFAEAIGDVRFKHRRRGFL